MRFLIALSALVFAIPMMTKASPIPTSESVSTKTESDIKERGIGIMRVPLIIGSLPEGMSITFESIDINKAEGFKHFYDMTGQRQLPLTITGEEVTEALNKGRRGIYIAEINSVTDSTGFWGALKSGQAGSATVYFTINGQAPGFNGTASEKRQGSLTISTSKWGAFSRPDETFFSWSIAGKTGASSGKTPDLTYLDDSVMAVLADPITKQYAFSVANQPLPMLRFLQKAISGLIAGHVLAVTALMGPTGLAWTVGETTWQVIAWGASVTATYGAM